MLFKTGAETWRLHRAGHLLFQPAGAARGKK